MASKKRALEPMPSSTTTTMMSDSGSPQASAPSPSTLKERPIKSQRAARASRACRTCRRQKTRCFPALNTRSCLRCKTLALECSFLDGVDEDNGSVMPIPADVSTLGDNSAYHMGGSLNSASGSRLDSLEANVGEILKILKNNESDRNRVGGRSRKEYKETPSFGLPSIAFVTSPFNSFGALVSSRNLPAPITRLYNPQMVLHDQDIITLGLITEEQATYLLGYFREHLNHWVSFPEDVPVTSLLDRIRRRCSLLLTVVCCVSIRFYDRNLKAKVYRLLLQKMQTELHQSLLVVPQTIEFMQALAIIAIYASSISEGDIVIDGWFYSSLALQHFITKDVLGLVMSFDGVGPVTEFDEITAYRVWNHLCLVHLVCCVLSGRMCILDEARLDLCRRTLELSSSSNFDGRMIAEIALQLIVYNFIESVQSLSQVEEELRKWKLEWGYLFDQPIVQFTESTYHYVYFMILLHWHYVQNAASNIPGASAAISIGMINGTQGNSEQLEKAFNSCEDTTIDRMVEHLFKVVDSLLVVQDDIYFAHLSDQVLFCGVYSAVMLIKLIKSMRQYGRSEVLDNSNVVSIAIAKITNLELKLRRVGAFPDDLILKYADAIAESLPTIQSPAI